MSEQAATTPRVNPDVLNKQEAPHLEAILFADYAAVAQDGKATVAGIIDQVFVDPDKRILGRIFIFVRTVETIGAPIEFSVFDP
ncbi:MAG TPA: hypothetical protein VFV34_22245, partial [Blastocatellia bacterium]|nr:hypothetical protein [Blastocatellia bacterium]